MSELQQYQDDLAEVEEWLKIAKRPNNIEFLNNRVKFLNNSIKILQPQKVEISDTDSVISCVDETTYVNITKYALDQDKYKLDVYINLDGIGQLPKQYIKVVFGPQNLDVRVIKFNGVNLRLLIKRTFGELRHQLCSYKVTKNNIVLNLELKNEAPWESLQSQENIFEKQKDEKVQQRWEKDGPITDDVKGMLTFLKDMYSSNDPEMKDCVRQFVQKTADLERSRN